MFRCLTQRTSSNWLFRTLNKLSPRCAKLVISTSPKETNMATQVVMPKLSPTMEEGQLSRWLKKEGDKISMGEPIAEIDTDKATMEMQALSNGVLRKILINEGESAPLGQPIAIIGEPDEDISELLKGAQKAKPAKADAAPAKLPESEAAPA